jgi:enoyl-CoA hydratase
MAKDFVRYEQEGDVAILRLDDGRANAISHDVIRALGGSLDRAEKEARAVLLLGRPGRFSAGFDLKTMGEGPESAAKLVGAGARLLLRLYELPLPLVVGCTGHALAMGSLLLLAGDWRVGAQGQFKIGLNEVAIRMTLPLFGVELARARLSRRHLQRAVIQAEIYDPEGALDAGYLDCVVPAEDLQQVALVDAARLAELPRSAFAETKLRVRRPTLALIRETLDQDLAGFGAGG